MSIEITTKEGVTWYGEIPMPSVTPGEEKGTWRLLQDYSLSITIKSKQYTFLIKAGFVFDGASIPRLLWRLCGHPMEAPRLAAALIHDWLYRAQLTDRDIADDIFNAICKAVGMSALRTGPEWLALRTCGWAAWKENHRWEKIAVAREYGFLEITERMVV